MVSAEWQVLETVTCGCYEGNNKYKVHDKGGKVFLYHAVETTGFCTRMICGVDRPFTIKLFDETGKKEEPMVRIHHPYSFFGWACFPCCLYNSEAHYMHDANGKLVSGRSHATLVSSVKTPYFGGFCRPTFNIHDKKGELKAIVKGPLCCVCTCCESDFKIYDKNESKIGEMVKLSPQSLKQLTLEIVSDANNYQLSFPAELDVSTKIGILAALFSIEYMFFEDDRSIAEGKCCDLYFCGAKISCIPQSLAFLCCFYGSKKQRKAAEEKKKSHGSPEDSNEMDR